LEREKRREKIGRSQIVVDVATQSVVSRGLASALKLNLDEAVHNITMLANRIGEGLLKICKSSKDYRQKYRRICSNLKDKRNRTLCEKLARGEVSVERLVSMGPDELASVDIHQMANEIAESSINSVILRNIKEDSASSENLVEI
jgi:hypothetical protein